MNREHSEHCKGPTSRKEREKWGTPSVYYAGRSAPPGRNDLAARLKKAGCPVNVDGSDWHTAGDLSPPAVQLPRQSDSIAVRANIQGSDPIDSTAHHLADLISELEDDLHKARAPRVGDVYSRPSSRVWKEYRNRLSIPSDVRNRIGSVYVLID